MNKAEIETKAKRKAGRRKCNNCKFYTNNVCIRPEVAKVCTENFIDGYYGRCMDEAKESKEKEDEIFNLFCANFGTDLQGRIFKLKEEIAELEKATKYYITKGTNEAKVDVIDEIADVNGVLFHFAMLLGYSPLKLLQRAYKKVKGREQAPNYARKHRHIKHWGECKDFKFEDTFGLGYCNVLKKPKLCDQPCEKE